MTAYHETTEQTIARRAHERYSPSDRELIQAKLLAELEKELAKLLDQE